MTTKFMNSGLFLLFCGQSPIT